MENQLLGNIHSFETFGTVDGPGIRFICFMQGCPLQCKFCHNRDTWETGKGKQYTVEQIYKKILRSKTYIEASGGGVTISGGEPLLQAEFLVELFKKLKEHNISTALDTAGSLPITPIIEELLTYTDLVLLDIKHIDNNKAIDLTSAPNTNTLNFAKYLNEKNIPMWINQVLVPGYTDDLNDLKKLKDFLSNFSNIQKIQILPYHSLGKYKWDEMNLKYPLENVREANQDDVDKAKEILGIE